MFVHVPNAWLAMGAWTVMTIASIGTLVWRHPLADVAAKSAAPLGAAFTFLALLTGSLWGRPMWGTYWVWDARLTSVLVLFLMYLGVIALWRTVDDPARAGRAAAILTLVGAVNLPIIKFSVDWWNTLHQPASVLRLGGPAIHPAILTPLLVMGLAFLLLFVTLAPRRHAQRDPAPARAHDVADAGARPRRALTMDLGPHAAFIIASYVAAGLVVIGLIVWVLADHDAQRRLIKDLEARGIKRRSGAVPP